jgi:hypothetical protein
VPYSSVVPLLLVRVPSVPVVAMTSPCRLATWNLLPVALWWMADRSPPMPPMLRVHPVPSSVHRDCPGFG